MPKNWPQSISINVISSAGHSGKRSWNPGHASAFPSLQMNAMIQAGLLQMDLILYGLEPDGPLMPAIGIYSAIGVYSDKTMQFMDSMGRHDLARRALMYFLEKQHDDGFMQNFGTLHGGNRGRAGRHRRALSLHARRPVGQADRPETDEIMRVHPPVAAAQSARRLAGEGLWTDRRSDRRSRRSVSFFSAERLRLSGLEPSRRDAGRNRSRGVCEVARRGGRD